MKKRTIFLTFLLLFTLAIPTHAMTNSPTGFRGLKWGTQPSQIKNLKQHSKIGDTTIYSRTTDDLTMGEAKLIEILYMFHETKGLYGATLKSTAGQYEKMETALWKQFGQPDSGSTFNWEWNDGKAMIILQFTETDMEVNAGIVSLYTLHSSK